MFKNIIFTEMLNNIKKEKNNLNYLETFKKEFFLSKEIIQKHKDFLESIKNIINVKITEKDFMVIYLFAFFDVEKDTDLETISLSLIDNIYNFQEINSEFIGLFNRYQDIYINWKNIDKKETLKKLTELFWEFELIHQLHINNNNDEDVKNFIENKNNKQKSILDLMYSIDKLQYFNSYVPVVFDENIVNNIHKNLKTAFWNLIKEELPSINAIIKLIEEIRIILIELVSNNNIIQNFDDIMDIQHIKTMNELGLTDVNYWFNKCSYLYSLLLELDSENNDEENKIKFNELNNFIKDDKNNMEKSYKCVDYLSYFMDKIILIKNIKLLNI